VVEVTVIDQDFEGDAYAPELGAGWHESARASHVSSNGLPYSFLTYRKRPA
jgi:dihydrofolate reductase